VNPKKERRPKSIKLKMKKILGHLNKYRKGLWQNSTFLHVKTLKKLETGGSYESTKDPK
jgi:hypothetical protein